MIPDERVQDDLSLEQAEGDVWDAPPADATRLVRTVHDVRRKPLGTLTPEDLRLLIAQQVGIDVVIPRVLTMLEQEPLLEGDYYPGDVLVAVLKVPPTYWSANPAQLARIQRIIESVSDNTDLKADIDTFRSQHH